MKKVAILIDGEWFRIAMLEKLYSSLPNGVTAAVAYKNALLAIDSKEESIFRIFYYDCEPHRGKARNPISKQSVHCISPEKSDARQRFFSELGQMPYIALRRGMLKRRGWVLKLAYVKRLLDSGVGPQLTADDVTVSMTQKGVDMRIGIDVATLALKNHVDRIILISGDMDMIPAMKLARREGIQVGIVQVAGKKISSELIEDADFVRTIKVKA